MRTLLLAPQPFYQERGTPIAVRLLAEDLARRGWQVDLLVYHEGVDIACPNLTLHRIRAWRWVRNVPPGFSIQKLACDWRMLWEALRMARRTRYDYVHAVEEAVFMARLIRRITGTPYVYDMDSSLPEQVVDKHGALRLFAPAMRRMEAAALRHALFVLPVCDALADLARRAGARDLLILRDAPLLGAGQGRVDPAARAPADGIRITYIGNLASYQGIGLLLEGFAQMSQRVPSAELVIVGGSTADIETYRRRSHELGIETRVRFTGAQPVGRIDEFMAEADILVSPRIQGVNTPMKIYSYLHSGKPVLATDIPSHTQVLTPDVALLVPPQAEKLAEGLARLATDAELRARLGKRAAEVAREKYSLEAFHTTVSEFCRRLESLLSPR